jgi:hypothetical protein
LVNGKGAATEIVLPAYGWGILAEAAGWLAQPPLVS